MSDGGSEPEPSEPRRTASAYNVFRHRNFRYFVASRTLSNMAQLVQSVAVGWQVYDMTRQPIDLGFVGLALFLPQILFALPAGQAADRFSRKRTALMALSVDAIASAILLALTAVGYRHVEGIFAVLVLFGIGRAFAGPTLQSISAGLGAARRLAQCRDLEFIDLADGRDHRSGAGRFPVRAGAGGRLRLRCSACC